MHLLLGHPRIPSARRLRGAGSPRPPGPDRRQPRRAARALRLAPGRPPAREPARLGRRRDGAPIAGVLVRSAGWPDPDGWDPADHAYMQAETRRPSRLARRPALPGGQPPRGGLFYRPRLPLLAWRPLLRRSGLPSTEVLVTNDPEVARAFRRRLEAEGVAGAVCTPLTGEAAGCSPTPDWAGLAALQERTPVCLAEPHGAATLACIVGDAVIWDRAPPPRRRALEPGAVRFAASAQLTFLEIAVAPVRRGLAVVLVDTLPRLDHFAGRRATASSTPWSRLLTRQARAAPPPRGVLSMILVAAALPTA